MLDGYGHCTGNARRGAKRGADTMRRAIHPLLAGLFLACAQADLAAAQSSAGPMSFAVDPLTAAIAEAAQRFALPATWIRAVVHAESSGNPHATSPKGAMGLMQVMPATWTKLRLIHGLGADPYDPHDNIIAGAAYIRALYDRYGTPGWIAAYNAGPGRYEAWLKGRPLPSETIAYVATVAPNLADDGMTPHARLAIAQHIVWTQSALFVTQQDHAGGTTDASSVPTARTTTDAPRTLSTRTTFAIAPRSTGLCVARPGQGGKR